MVLASSARKLFPDWPKLGARGLETFGKFIAMLVGEVVDVAGPLYTTLNHLIQTERHRAGITRHLIGGIVAVSNNRTVLFSNFFAHAFD